MRRRLRTLSVGLALVVLAGCTARAPETAPPTVDVPPPTGSLPPAGTADLAVEPMVAALLARTGTVLTRGGLIERRLRLDADGSPTYLLGGTTVVTRPHLALYLAFPDEDLDDLDRYLDAIAPLTREFAGAAFDRWPDLASFDICLVRASDSDDAPEPAIVLVDVTREGYATWLDAGGDLASLRALGGLGPDGVRLQLSDPVRAIADARDAAGD